MPSILIHLTSIQQHLVQKLVSRIINLDNLFGKEYIKHIKKIYCTTLMLQFDCVPVHCCTHKKENR